VARGFARFFSGGGVDEALREFRGAADRLPSNSKIRWVIGTLLRSQGDLEGALSRFTEASLIDPRSHFYVFEIVTALLMLQRFDEATQYADRLRVIAPEWVAGWVAKAPIYLYQGDVEAARQVMTDVSLQAGALDRLVPHLIEDALYRPEWEMVVPESFHDKVMGLTLQTAAVDSADYYLAKARTFRVRGDRPRQVAYLDSLVSVLELRIESMPTLTLSRLDLGSAYAALGRTEDARAQAAVLDGLRLSERDRFRGFFAAMDLARLHAAIGDADAAISGLQTLAQLPSPLTGAFLAADPAFVSLHGDPRFQAIVDGL